MEFIKTLNHPVALAWNFLLNLSYFRAQTISICFISSLDKFLFQYSQFVRRRSSVTWPAGLRPGQALANSAQRTSTLNCVPTWSTPLEPWRITSWLWTKIRRRMRLANSKPWCNWERRTLTSRCVLCRIPISYRFGNHQYVHHRVDSTEDISTPEFPVFSVI